MTDVTGPRASTLAGLPCNLRDLAEIPTAGGAALRSGVLFRSDDLAPAGEQRVAQLVADLDLALVVDLRSAEEVDQLGRGGLEDTGVRVEHLPLSLTRRAVGTGTELIEELPTTPQELGRFYAAAVESAAPQLARGLELLATAPGPTLFHCVAGKDRTGLLAALALTALGVPGDRIVEDYARTEERMPILLEQHRLGSGVADAERAERIRSLPEVLLAAPSAAMETCLAALEERHRDPLAPLRQAGLTDRMLHALRGRLVAAG